MRLPCHPWGAKAGPGAAVSHEAVGVRSLSRLLIYGEYCSHMEHAQNTLNQLLAGREDFRQKVEVMGAPGWSPAHLLTGPLLALTGGRWM